MPEQIHDLDDQPTFNVVQIIGMSVVLFCAVFGAFLMTGSGFFMSLFGAWLGGAFLTLLIAGGVFWLQTRGVAEIGFAPRSLARHPDARTAELVPEQIVDSLQAWEVDLALEMSFLHGAENADLNRKSKSGPFATFDVRGKEIAEDSSQVAEKRSLRIQLREEGTPFEARERRVNRD